MTNSEGMVTAVRFVSHRPRYPVGSPVPGFSPICAVLYADGDCEVYLLERGGGATLLLIVARAGGDAPTFAQECSWLEQHGCEILASPTMAPGAHHFVTRVYGSWMAEIPAQPLSERELYGLLVSLINLATDAIDHGLSLTAIRPLLWVESSVELLRLSSVYVGRSGVGEAEVIRQIGQTFLWAATGISSREMENASDEERFRSWCQNADRGLAHVISRRVGPGDAIVTLYDLRREVGSLLIRLSETPPAAQRIASRYVNLSPHRFLWLITERPG